MSPLNRSFTECSIEPEPSSGLSPSAEAARSQQLSAQRNAALEKESRRAYQAFENRLIIGQMNSLPNWLKQEQPSFLDAAAFFSTRCNPSGPMWEERALMDFNLKSARMHAASNDLDLAAAKWSQALAVAPWNEEARSGLTDIAQRGRPQANVELRERTLELVAAFNADLPRNPRDLTRLGDDRLILTCGEDNRLHIFDAASLKRADVFQPGDVQALNAVAVAHDGSILVGDSQAGAVVRVDQKGKTLERIELASLLSLEKNSFNLNWLCTQGTDVFILAERRDHKKTLLFRIDEAGAAHAVDTGELGDSCYCASLNGSIVVADHRDFWSRELYRLDGAENRLTHMPTRENGMLIRLVEGDDGFFMTQNYKYICKTNMEGETLFWARLESLTADAHALCGMAFIPEKDHGTLFVVDRLARIYKFKV